MTPTLYVIPPTINAEGVDRRVEAFNHAMLAMNRSLFWGSTFILSDGDRDLIVAEPGGPLRVTDEDGRLVVAPDQDFQATVRSAWWGRDAGRADGSVEAGEQPVRVGPGQVQEAEQGRVRH